MKLSRRQFVGALGIGLGILAVPIPAKPKPTDIDGSWISWQPPSRNPTLISIRGNFGNGHITILNGSKEAVTRIKTTVGSKIYPIETKISPPYTFIWGSDL